MGLDIDGVVADSSPWLEEALSEILGRLVKREEIVKYDFSNFGIEDWRMRKETTRERLMTAKPIEGAAETLRKLYESGYFLAYISARSDFLPEEDTRDWLNVHGIPHNYVRHVYKSRDKKGLIELGDFDWFIEDRFDTCTSLADIGVKSILFKQPWNEKEFGKNGQDNYITRVNSWREIERVLID